MTENKTAALVLQHQNGKKSQAASTTTGTIIVYQAIAACKVYLLRCGAILAALASVWWLFAIIEGTAGGVTGPLVLAGVCGWLAKLLADAAGRGYIDGRPQRKN